MTTGRVLDMADLAPEYDIVIVGAGPAGMSAALEAEGSGARVLVVDENAGPGGQIYRSIGRNIRHEDDVLGHDYWAGRDIVDAFERSNADYAAGTTVWSLEPALTGSRRLSLGVSLSGRATMVGVDAVILATGAIERPFPVVGWTLPGVMSAGAAQIALKSAQIIPEGRIVLAGCGPLLYLVASQLLAAGADIAAMLTTTDSSGRVAALRHLPDFLRSAYLHKGVKLMREVHRHVPVHSGVRSLSIEGREKAVAVRFSQGRKSRRIEADCILLHHGVIPSINLASAAGCALEWSNRQRAFVPSSDAEGRSSVEGILLAGDGAGIGGAQYAALSGRNAAVTALSDLGRMSQHNAAHRRRQIDTEQRIWRRGRAFLDALYAPARAFRAPADPETIVCRCEEIRASEIREAVALDVPGPNQLKTFLRCGMGPCQGRLCAQTVSEIIADERRESPGDAGVFRFRSPVKPLRLSELAALPQTPDARRAVYGAHDTNDNPIALDEGTSHD